MKKTLFLCLLCALAGSVQGGEARAVPIDIYIVIDRSAAMEQSKEAALSWLCEKIDLFVNGDRLWLWSAGAKPELVYSGEIGADKETIKALVRSIPFGEDASDCGAALGEARVLALQSRGEGAWGERIAYTLLLTAAGDRDAPAGSEGPAPVLLRYSRVEDFTGWRALTVGIDIEQKVRQSVDYYMRRR